MVFVTVLVVMNEVYSIPVNNGRDFFVWTDITTKNFDLREVATSSILQESGFDVVPARMIEANNLSLQVIYSCIDCDDVLTIENLRIVEKIEMEVFLSK